MLYIFRRYRLSYSIFIEVFKFLVYFLIPFFRFVCVLVRRIRYIIVAFQECERMNYLTNEMKRSLRELDLGLKGELTITSEMEVLENALFLDQVPVIWASRAYPSLLGLTNWFVDLLMRLRELEAWSTDFVVKKIDFFYFVTEKSMFAYRSFFSSFFFHYTLVRMPKINILLSSFFAFDFSADITVTDLRVVGWILQSTIAVDCHHAKYGTS